MATTGTPKLNASIIETGSPSDVDSDIMAATPFSR